MAGFADLIRTGLGIADSLTSTMQVTVSHRRVLPTGTGAAQDVYGERQLDLVRTYGAIVERKVQTVRLATGEERLIQTRMMIPRAVVVTTRDEFKIGTETLGPIVNVQGAADPAGGTYYTEIWFG
jgi:hypothetical protein